MLTTTTSSEDEPSRLPARSGHGAASVIPRLHERDPMVIPDHHGEAPREDTANPDSQRERAERAA
jgi:hypothetical protein